MSLKEIAVTDELPGRAVDALAERYRVRVHRGGLLADPSSVAGFIAGAEAAITLLANPVSREVLEACPNLRVVANYAVGYDNIELGAARERGVWVTNTPDVLTDATADLAWTLLLAVARRVREGEAMVRRGDFHGWGARLLLGQGLQGERLGIVGFGRIGQAVARRALAFGMEVVYAARRATPCAGLQARQLEMEELLATSRVVSLHCPLTPDTHHLLDQRRLGLMPRGAILINTARGPVVDENALVQALAEGQLAGAGLDVYEEEPAVHPGLLGRDDVVLLPHVGSATVQTRTAMAELAAANVSAVLEGRRPLTVGVEGRGESR